MNIVVKRGYENRDPFATSDRDPIGRAAGKGDRNRSASEKFRANYAKINWHRIHKGRRK